MFNGIGGILQHLLSYPVLICSIIAVIASITILIAKRKTIKKSIKIVLIILTIIAILIIAFFIFMVIVSGNNHPEIPPVTLNDYKPMIFIQDTLYGDTGYVVNDFPDNSDLIGEIKTVMPQNAPMVKENNTSNLVQAGSEVYAVPSDSSKIYVRLPDGRYSIYEEIE